jgi:hypothetical protein
MQRANKRLLPLVAIGFLLASCSITPPSVAQISPDPALFMVSYQLYYKTKNEHEIVVPVGFITDLASIPSWLWWWESPHEGTMGPAIVHDYLYWQQQCTKDEADAVMYLAMNDVGIRSSKREVIYLGVRSEYARRAWDKNKLARENGELRFYTKKYFHHLMSSDVVPGMTLKEMQNGATLAGGMYAPSRDNPMVKLACEESLLEYKAL